MASIDQLKTMVNSKLGYASPNQYMITMPTNFRSQGILGGLANILSNPISLITGNNSSGSDLNLLCNRVAMPGKSILTADRVISMEAQKVPYGYLAADISMTFYIMNDYGVKKYFDAWQGSIIDEENNTANYKVDYAKSVKIHQMRRPILNKSFGLGPLNFDLGIGGGVVYTVELLEAFPVNVSQIELSNDLDGLVQLTVDFAYTRYLVRNEGGGLIQLSGGLGSIF